MPQYKVNIGPSQAKVAVSDYSVNIGPYQGSGVPVVTAQSADQSVHVGDVVSMWITAIGTPTPTYQWYKGIVLIVGADSSTYNFTAGINSGGIYTCVASNINGDTTSPNITLSVYAYVVSHSSSANYTAGSAMSLNVVAAGYPTPLSYQWYKNGGIIVGATSSTYSNYVGFVVGSIETYYCKVDNSLSHPVDSDLIIITVIPNLYGHKLFNVPTDLSREIP
jgi:hypothetical protein